MIRHALAPHLPTAARALGIPLALSPSADGVALTFDDGPHPEGTPAVLELLAGAGVRATFFLVGEQVRQRPELAARIVTEGHAVGVHGYRHTLQLRMSAAAVRADIRRGMTIIESSSGRQPVLHRPPYGVYSGAGLNAARDAGLKPMLWSRWGKDWRRFTTPVRIASRVTDELRPGDVILLHDGDFYSAKNSHERMIGALEIILSVLKQRRLGTVLPV